MLRRTKELVAKDLPDKTQIIKYTQFDSKQSKLYESIRVTMEKKVREVVSKKGIGSSHITILDALLKLRQVCCDPSLVKVEEAQKIQNSAKLELLLDLLDELLQEDRKILLFSQPHSPVLSQKPLYYFFVSNPIFALPKHRENTIHHRHIHNSSAQYKDMEYSITPLCKSPIRKIFPL